MPSGKCVRARFKIGRRTIPGGAGVVRVSGKVNGVRVHGGKVNAVKVSTIQEKSHPGHRTIHHKESDSRIRVVAFFG